PSIAAPAARRPHRRGAAGQATERGIPKNAPLRTPIVVSRPFGFSTKLWASRRLCRDHLMEIGAHGFDVVEVAAVAAHFEPSQGAGPAARQQRPAEARPTLHAVAAPPGEREPMEHALLVARRIPFSVIVVPVGSPKSASKMIDRLAPLAEPL